MSSLEQLEHFFQVGIWKEEKSEESKSMVDAAMELPYVDSQRAVNLFEEK